jgi:hypothetical protein
VVSGAALWMLNFTWATKTSSDELVGETITLPVPWPVTAVSGLWVAVGSLAAAGAAICASAGS